MFKKLISIISAVLFTTIVIAQTTGNFRNKISLNAYSFNNLLKENQLYPSKGMSLNGLLDFCARHHFDAVDITGYYFPGYPKPPADSLVYSIKKKVHSLGLGISGTGVKNDFANPDPAKRAADVQHVKDWIDIASKLGAPVIRIFSGNIAKGYETKWDSVANYMATSIRECAEYAKQKGIIIGIQNHDDFLKTASQTLKLLKLIDNEWVGIVVDIGSFPTDDPYQDIEAVMAHAVNFQFKEFVKTARGTQKTNVAKIIRIVSNSTYKGYLPIETLPDPLNKSISYDPERSVPVFLKKIRSEAAKLK